MLDSTCNAIGNFIATALLYPTYTIFMATAFLPFFLLDPYIRTFAVVVSHILVIGIL